MDILSLKPEAFGLDISDISLKIASLKKRGKFLALNSFCELEIPPGIIKEGEIRDENALAKIIKEALSKIKGKKIKTKYVIASLPEEKAFLQVIQLPKMPQEDLKSAVVYEAENYIPLPIEEVYLDSQIVPPIVDHLDHLDVLIAALPKKTIDPYISVLKAVGLKPVALEIESLSISRALVKNEVSPSPVFLIDFGACRTSFIIFSGYSLKFTNSIPISSRNLTETIALTLRLDFKKAEELKIKYGIKKEGKNEEANKIFEVLKPALNDLVKEIKKCLDYYQAHSSHEHLPPNGKGVGKILLSGGGANLKGLTEFLSSELKIPVALANPWVNILPSPLKEVPQLSFEESLRYTTALGLALRGINK